MSIVGALQQAGYKPEKSTAGDKPILVGVYKAVFVEWAVMEDKGYGPSIYAQFKVSETLAGMDSRSQFPEFKDYYNTSPEKVNSKRNGLAKLLNGFFSVGLNVDSSTDEKFQESLNNLKGSAEVYISAYVKEPRRQNEQGTWEVNPEGDNKQGFTFLTSRNAEKLAAKSKKDVGHPL